MIRTDFREILRALVAQDVNFILVGALSAVLQGAPVMTIDVDIVHARDEKNIQALLAALDELEAVFRGHPGKIQPRAEHLATEGHQLLTTRWGPLDLLGAIEFDLTYEDLLPDAVHISLDDETIPILSLAKYLELKETSDRAKDQARLPVLRETLKLQNISSPDEDD